MTVNTEPIVILVSSDFEWAIVKKVLPHIKEESTTPFGEQFATELNGKALTFIHGGWGKIAAAASVQYAVDHLAPKLLVNIGTCGSLHKSMQRGDLLLANKTVVYDIVEQMGNPDEAIDAYTTEFDTSWAKCLKEVQQGILVSGDRDIVQGDIQELRSKYGATAADWESGSIAWTAKKNNTQLFIIRGVSDVVSEAEALAYGDLDHFEEGTEMVMKRLIETLPVCLDLWEKNTKS